MNSAISICHNSTCMCICNGYTVVERLPSCTCSTCINNQYYTDCHCIKLPVLILCLKCISLRIFFFVFKMEPCWIVCVCVIFTLKPSVTNNQIHNAHVRYCDLLADTQQKMCLAQIESQYLSTYILFYIYYTLVRYNIKTRNVMTRTLFANIFYSNITEHYSLKTYSCFF